MEKPIKSLLGLSTKEFEGIAHGQIGIKHTGNGVFHLHDVSTGKHLKTLNVNTAKPVEEAEVEEHEDLSM